MQHLRLPPGRQGEHGNIQKFQLIIGIFIWSKHELKLWVLPGPGGNHALEISARVQLISSQLIGVTYFTMIIFTEFIKKENKSKNGEAMSKFWIEKVQYSLLRFGPFSSLKDIIVLDSSNDRKFSLHIIFRGHLNWKNVNISYLIVIMSNYKVQFSQNYNPSPNSSESQTSSILSIEVAL